jgi:hypothetical protein
MTNSLYSVLNKGGKWDIRDIKKNENEFKCYFRYIIEDKVGWGLLAQNVTN